MLQAEQIDQIIVNLIRTWQTSGYSLDIEKTWRDLWRQANAAGALESLPIETAAGIVSFGYELLRFKSPLEVIAMLERWRGHPEFAAAHPITRSVLTCYLGVVLVISGDQNAGAIAFSEVLDGSKPSSRSAIVRGGLSTLCSQLDPVTPVAEPLQKVVHRVMNTLGSRADEPKTFGGIGELL